jgi:hypothetical protein
LFEAREPIRIGLRRAVASREAGAQRTHTIQRGKGVGSGTRPRHRITVREDTAESCAKPYVLLKAAQAEAKDHADDTRTCAGSRTR